MRGLLPAIVELMAGVIIALILTTAVRLSSGTSGATRDGVTLEVSKSESLRRAPRINTLPVVARRDDSNLRL